jgi:hypothetical protein
MAGVLAGALVLGAKDSVRVCGTSPTLEAAQCMLHSLQGVVEAVKAQWQ